MSAKKKTPKCSTAPKARPIPGEQALHRVLDDEPDNLLVTVATPSSGTSTFSRDNWEHFPSWFLLQKAKLHSGREEVLTFIICRFDRSCEMEVPRLDAPGSVRVPQQTVMGCYVTRDGVTGVSAQ